MTIFGKTNTESRESQGETVLFVKGEHVLLAMTQQMFELLYDTVLVADRPRITLKLQNILSGVSH